MFEELIRERRTVRLFYGKETSVYFTGIIVDYDERSGFIKLDSPGLTFPVSSIVKIEIVTKNNQTHLLKANQFLFTSADFDNAIYVQAQVAVWQHGERITFGVVEEHAEMSVTIRRRQFYKHDYIFKVVSEE